MALTATATQSVKNELISILRDPVLTISSVNQENIFYTVQELKFQRGLQGTCKSHSENTCTILFSLNLVDSDRASQIAKQLISFIENKEQRVIIYVDFIKDVAPLAISLRQAGFETCSYHGQKMSGHDKLQSMESWRSNAVKIMVCTTAFGMGIDQPDVEVVIRVGCPPTIETMIQEFGRAGRDGRQAKGEHLLPVHVH